eukprot:TRINITY_DN14208_c0_g1_i1.p1 TRINITY_DN14208_c0_g1~~TRINITY_DN14208_c0_g1_i1.p1  ORF type:complete len:171 (-),score=20.13 TRINITY_DN14208_c0_g1_i1:110-622(-)
MATLRMVIEHLFVCRTLSFNGDGVDSSYQVDLNDPYYNVIPFSDAEQGQWMTNIRDRPCNSGVGSSPDVNAVMRAAIDQFATYGSDNLLRNKKIILFNSDSTDSPDTVCSNYEEWIKTGGENDERGANQAGEGINVVIANFYGTAECTGEPDVELDCGYKRSCQSQGEMS